MTIRNLFTTLTSARRHLRAHVHAGVLVLVLVGMASPLLADCDILAPSLTGFDFDPKVVDVSAGDAQVTCSMVVSDDLAGVSEATCSFAGPFFLQSRECTAAAPSTGSPTAGTFSCAVTIPQFANTGTWTASVELVDRVGNERPYGSFELSGAGYPADLSVASAPSDLGAPALTGLTLSSTAVDVSAGPATVTCSMTYVDSPAGVSEATCRLQSPDVFVNRACTADAPSSGDRSNGTFSCDVEIPRYADAGTWTVNLQSLDLVGNIGFIDPFTLATLGFPSEVLVTSIPEDVVAPDVVGFDFTPRSIDVSATDATVTCTVDVTDALAGAQLVGCAFASPSEVQGAGCFATAPTNGTPHNGSYRCVANVPRYSEGGTWTANVFIEDRAGNLVGLGPDELGPSGFPTELTIDCDGAGGGAEAVLRWDASTTLAWDPVAGAARYNVYRGDLEALPGDYGECRNGSDPDATDTAYEDAEAPQPVGSAFTYLVSVTVDGVEGTLGRASDGTARTVIAPCP